MIFGTTASAIILGLVLCVLNYLGAINISWVWATCPFWIGFALDILLIIFGLIFNFRYFKKHKGEL